jgi:aryl-alcohol dehydrogenase-like predicted oxidoreductase
VSVAGLGCNNFGMRIDQEKTIEVVDAAIEAGITFFDTARSYGDGKSEEFLGVALKGRRDQVVVGTKFGSGRLSAPRGSRSEIVRSAEASLRALDTDYLDLLQFHVPDPETPIAETLGALDDLVHAGKVRYVGCSNFSGWMVADAHWTAVTRGFNPFVCVQNQWSLLQREIETEVTTAASRFGLGILPYFPLASGLLTGKMRGGEAPEGSRLSSKAFGWVANERNHEKVERLAAYAEERGWTLTRLALSWLASQPVVGSVIAGATSAEQVRENAASTKTDLSPEQIAEIGELVGR